LIRSGEDEVHTLPDQLRSQLGQPLGLAAREPAFDGEGLALDPPQLAQAFAEGVEIERVHLGRER
jgi:hypothetical protein